jgi:hypothetical protein
MPERATILEYISKGLFILMRVFQIAFVASVGVCLVALLVFVCITGDLLSPTSSENPHVQGLLNIMKVDLGLIVILLRVIVVIYCC